jgi:preprotein translocase SecF subunit
MKPFYTIMFGASVALLVASIVALSVWGLNLGVDFTGGSISELEFSERPTNTALSDALMALNIPALREVSVNPSGERGMIVRTGQLTEEEHQRMLAGVKAAFPSAAATELRFDSIGPVVGEELKNKSISGIAILLVAVLIYIAWMFRTLSRSLSLWAMSAGTVLGLAHDIIIPMGLFAVLGHFMGIQVTGIFVAAVLTILGYTVSDKVVIYDRVRENLLRGSKEPLADLVHRSVMQTLVRSINNTLVVILSSLSVFLFGGESIKYFALALMVGIGLGAYSSIFVASPILVWMGKDRVR